VVISRKQVHESVGTRVSLGLTSAILSLGVAAFTPAAAANLVVDGGFEGDVSQNYSAADYLFPLGPSTFGPWTVNSGFVFVDGFGVQAHSGDSSLNLAPGNPAFPSDITQNFATTAGQTYELSFFAAAGGENTFSVKFDGATVRGSPTSLPSTIPELATDFTGDYREYDFTVLATSAESVLEFGGTSTDDPGHGPDTLQLDDISFTPTAVPEPAMWSMMLVGLLGVAGWTRISRRRTSGLARLA
jgi:PEP-CTERM motif